MYAQLSHGLMAQILRECDQPLVVVEASAAGQSVYWANGAFEALTGFSGEQLAAEGHAYLREPEETRERLVRELAAVPLEDREPGDPPPEFCLPGRRCDGTIAWWQVKPCPLYAHPGEKPTHWVLQFSEKRSVEPARPLAPVRRASAPVQSLRPGDRRDAVTGILGREYFEEIFRRQFALAQRQEISVALLLFEVDCFAEYRQTFGEKAADSCLRMVAHGVNAAMRRASDLVARVGASRFAAVGMGMTHEAAQAHVRRIQAEVERMCLHHPRSRNSRYVTVSVAADTRVPGLEESYTEMLEAAQRRLLRGMVTAVPLAPAKATA